MKRFKQFVDDERCTAVEQVNEHTKLYPTTKVVGYQIGSHDVLGIDQAYILVEYKEDE
ncbi:hypothetical protein MUA52_05100 [Staphylococcus agnetis]|uniref:hypothetical protein n=1 Tax=Staphylococcus agnetis TaxID=985762 RepID=UPI0021D3AD12|nr:hypothetical protein [Staphylococcus agnetis]UXU66010.1 hypothetical protein MUA52_09260 [Staphylococcus agnetis]UXU67463.1 hypothetical protein MUA52_05100 [Staphylococcus agnetis]